MSAALAQLISQWAEENLQINLWKTKPGNYQANVKEIASDAWTCVIDADPIEALVRALRQRAARLPTRKVVGSTEMQIDIEDAIAAAADDVYEDFDLG